MKNDNRKETDPPAPPNIIFSDPALGKAIWRKFVETTAAGAGRKE